MPVGWAPYLWLYLPRFSCTIPMALSAQILIHFTLGSVCPDDSHAPYPWLCLPRFSGMFWLCFTCTAWRWWQIILTVEKQITGMRSSTFLFSISKCLWGREARGTQWRRYSGVARIGSGRLSTQADLPLFDILSSIPHGSKTMWLWTSDETLAWIEAECRTKAIGVSLQVIAGELYFCKNAKS